MQSYDPKQAEPKWQKYWQDKKLFAADEKSQKPKKYILDMFPYPSGDGLHVGHGKIYTASDILARYWRQRGYNVLHPMGWDAFGLPAENSAIKFKIHPTELTERNINRFRGQMQALGLSYDWDREINTTDPDYYKWTQWIFLQLFKKGLAYEATIPINWCPKDKTGLANEEVVDGKCDRCGTPVELKPMRQWLLKITEYADRLLAGLDELDWPEFIKEQQRNWIGKSEGHEVVFNVESRSETITVFTTRIDTISGATYMVLAPENSLVKALTTDDYKKAGQAYQKEAQNKTILERTDLNKNKAGVFTGSYAINPVTNEKMPIWVADYVLASYGTGAIMAVPDIDERDREFAAIYSLPVKQTAVDASWGEKLVTQKIAQVKTQYKLRDWVFSRQRYWGEPIPLVHCEKCGIVAVPEEQLPVKLPDVENYEPTGTGESPLAGIAEWVNTTCPQCDGPAKRETNTMPQWAGSSWYWIRFTDPSNQAAIASKQAAEYWLPVDVYLGGAEHAVLHLLYARFWNMVLFDIDAVAKPEPFNSLRNVGLLLGEDGQKMSKSRGNVITPDAVIAQYSADVLRLYEMFMGPFEGSAPWQSSSIAGVARFLQRVWKLIQQPTGKTTPELEAKLHQTIAKITEATEQLHFNSAIAALMELLNAAEAADGVSKEFYEIVIQLLNPYAPHITEEIWQALGHTDSLVHHEWPVASEQLLKQSTVTIPVQVNGKVRGTLQVAADISQAEVETVARALPNVAKYLENVTPQKVIFIPNRLINFVLN